MTNGADGTGAIVNSMKTIVDNYVNNRKLSAVMLGTYDGNAIVVNDQLAIPMEMIKNMLSSLMVGDKVKLLRNDGGREYYILEILGGSGAAGFSESEGG